MNSLIQSNRAALETLCRLHHVKRLDLFGSATTAAFDHETSDLDFLVEFDNVPEMNRADQYFGLLESLQGLFRRDVDLVTFKSMRNPYFIRNVDETRLSLYAA